MENLFKNAKFGDKFLTQDGRIAVLIFPYYNNNQTVRLCVEDGDEFDVYLNGWVDTRFWSDGLCIHSKYKEPIDEKKLDELTDEYAECESIQNNYASFKAGYRKAKEELV